MLNTSNRRAYNYALIQYPIAIIKYRIPIIKYTFHKE